MKYFKIPIFILTCIFVISIAQTNKLRGRAVTTSGGIVTGNNDRILFTSFGQVGVGTMSQGDYQLYLGVIRPGIGGISISGTVFYYDTTPYRPVPAVKLLLTGAIIDSTLTNASGYYIFDSLSTGNYTVTPQKNNLVNDPAITPFDAALVLRHIVGLDTLDSLQFIAGDVSGNGQISSFDAALILRYSVLLIEHFPVGARPGGDTVDWAFRPLSRTYTSLTSNMENQNYAAILYGDVSGNWSPSEDIIAFEPEIDDFIWGGNLPENEEIQNFYYETTQRVASSDQTELNLTKSDQISTKPLAKKNGIMIQTELQKTEASVFPIRISNAKDVIAAVIILTYDPDEVEIKDVSLGTSTANYLIAWVANNGTIRIALAGSRALNGGVELANVSYMIKGEGKFQIQNSRFKILSLVLNEGQELITTISKEGIADNMKNLPTQFSLMSNQPNPFISHTAIRYALPTCGKVSLQIFDVTGTLVKTLVNESQKVGYHSILWDGTNYQNQKIASGIYFYEMKTDNFIARMKTIILR